MGPAVGRVHPPTNHPAAHCPAAPPLKFCVGMERGNQVGFGCAGLASPEVHPQFRKSAFPPPKLPHRSRETGPPNEAPAVTDYPPAYLRVPVPCRAQEPLEP